MGRVELTVQNENSVESERQMSMVVVHSNSVDCSRLSSEVERGAFSLRLSPTSPAARSVHPGTDSFSFFSGCLIPADQRSEPCRLVQIHERYQGRSGSELQSSQSRDDEHCFERIMWSAKEISRDFLSACHGEPDDLCQLSEDWFQQDARQYDEQQQQQKKQWALRRPDELHGLHHWKKFSSPRSTSSHRSRQLTYTPYRPAY